MVFPQSIVLRLILHSSISASRGRELATKFAPFIRSGDRTFDLLLKGLAAEPPCQL
ncbi:hypothetical protein P3S68_011988 [Capsicum galapagoense]